MLRRGLNVRVFVASFLTTGSARKLTASAPAIAGMRQVPDQKLHMTLHFLGDVPEAAATEVCALVDGLGGNPFSVRVAGIAGFPGAARARAVVALLEVPDQVFEWQRALAAGWPVADDTRSFIPHVTLGRSRRGICLLESTDGLAGMTVELQAPAAYRSETLPEGARYTRLD